MTTVSELPRRSWRRPRPSRVEGVSDEALLAAIAAGDEAAAAALVGRHQARVYGIAYAITADRSAAEDVAQEAFLRVWRHAAVFDAHRASAQTWISSITRNLAIDAIRARRSSPVDPHDALSNREGPSPDATAEERVLDAELVDLVKEVVNGLPDDQRRALLRAAYYGQTAAEVADAEAIPLGTAKSRIRLALTKVRDALAEEKGASVEPGA